MRQSLKILLSIFTLLESVSFGEDVQFARNPFPHELERLVGNPLSHPVKIEWKAPEPPQTNLTIYAVEPPRYDERRLRALAEAVAISRSQTA